VCTYEPYNNLYVLAEMNSINLIDVKTRYCYSLPFYVPVKLIIFHLFGTDLYVQFNLYSSFLHV